MFWCVFWFRIKKQIRIIIWMFFIKQLFFINPVSSNSQGYKITKKKEKLGKSLPITVLEPITSVITGQRVNQCATAVSIYIDLR